MLSFVVAAHASPCDIPTSPLATVPASNVAACSQACADQPGCGAYTFISGWDRCRLHAPTTRRVNVRMFAATLALVSGERTLSAPQPDMDHRGRDLESAPRDLPSAEACGQACLQEPSCMGYAYVEGYRSCWLKATDGVLQPKTFTCGSR